MRRAGVALAIVCTMLVTSAGACQQSTADEPLPPPSELATRTFPEGSTRQGVDALYVGRQRPDCDEVLLLTADGSAHHIATCGASVDPYLADPASWIDETTGDYAYRGDMLWIRTVAWDSITESFELTEWEFRYCAEGLRDIPPADFRRVPFEYRLVEGAGPPDAPPCPPSSNP